MQNATEYLKSYTNQNIFMLHCTKWNAVGRYPFRLFEKLHWKISQSRLEVCLNVNRHFGWLICNMLMQVIDYQ